MLMDHLTDGEVEGFLSGCLPPEDLRRVVRHLASGCQECGTRIHVAVPPEMFLPLGPPPQEDAYDACIDRALKEARRRTRRWRKEQERAEGGGGGGRRRGECSGARGARPGLGPGEECHFQRSDRLPDADARPLGPC